jgi:hypothetical protein
MPINAIKSQAGIELIEITRMSGRPARLSERSYLVTVRGVKEPFYQGWDIGRAETAFESALAHRTASRQWKK